jgi:hypothetical protein
VSATNRSAVRCPDDFYETPTWCVRRLLDRVWLPRRGATYLEPAAGHGAIIKAVDTYDASPVGWTAIELRHESKQYLAGLVDGPDLFMGIDFLRGDFVGCDWDVCITNPPYSLAMEFIQEALPLAYFVVMLLRLNFLGSLKRSSFFRSEMPDVYVLPNRPSFTGGPTDATEYAWFVWTPSRGRSTGRIGILNDTPSEERR